MSTKDTSSDGVSEPERTSPCASRTDWTRVDALTGEETVAAAIGDRDNPPWTDEQLARARRVALIKQLRLTLGLGRAAFAARYHFDEKLIAAWERRELEPDALATAYLQVIAADPEGVARTVATPAVAAE